MTKNKLSTRYYSSDHEESVCKALGGSKQPNSGASKFYAGDVVTDRFLIECKTCIDEKESFSIKKKWLQKNKEEAFQIRKEYSALCFRFGPGQTNNNYYIIDEQLMKELVNYLEGK